MKKTLKIFVVLFFVAVLAGMLVACNNAEETITISFETNGGLEVPSVTINVGDDLDAPTPVRAGYTFKGWYTDASLQTAFEGPATYNLTLFAKWEANQNTLSFDANGGEGEMPDIAMATDSGENLPACAFEKEGYLFVGWATTAGGNVAYADQTLYTMGPESQYTLYAKWAAALQVNFVANGGTGIMDAIEVPAEYAFMLPRNTFAKSGYVFAGWATTEGGDAVYDDKAPVTAGTSDITLYAVWADIESLVDLSHVEEGYILFGEYPQSVASPEAVAAMGTAADAKGYYTSTYDNAKYVKVTADPNPSDNYDCMFDDRTLVMEGAVYYFKLEPIRWRILAEDNGTYTLLAENILETLPFDDNSNYWHQSDIRSWLNNVFYHQIFNKVQRALVQNARNITKYNELNGEFDVEYETGDYVFLPSFEDMTNEDYGFNANFGQESTSGSRQAITTEYCRAKGVVVSTVAKLHGNTDWHFGKGFYLTRSYRDPGSIYRVQYIGTIEGADPAQTRNGIRPMMVLVIP